MIHQVVRFACMMMASMMLAIVPQEMTCFLSNFILHTLGVHGTFANKELGFKRFLDFYHMEGAGVVLYNHPTFYDFAVLAKEFGHRCRFLAFAHRLPFPINIIAHKLNAMIIKPGSGASFILRNVIQSRKPSTPIMTLAPAAGEVPNDYEEHPNRLAEFRSGGFLARSPILPVVIRYDTHEPWRNESIVHAVWRRLSGKPIRYKLHVLPPMVPDVNESIESFKERVRKTMEAVPIDDSQFEEQKSTYHGSPFLVVSSCLFLIPSWMCAVRGLYFACSGMLLTWFNSICYHSTGGHHAKFVDMMSNAVFGVIFTIIALMRGNFITVWMSLCALFGHKISKQWKHTHIPHAVLVHLPAFLGFLAVARCSL